MFCLYIFSQADVLLDKFKTVLLPDIQRRKIDGKPCEMKCLEWYVDKCLACD